MQIEYLEPADGAYVAGVCNINAREIARRRVFGSVAVGGAIVFGVLLVGVDAPRLVRGLVVLPLFVGLISLEEARTRFCGGFAFLGIRSKAGSDATEKVADADDLAADRATARRMVAYCGVIAVAVATAFVLLPI